MSALTPMRVIEVTSNEGGTHLVSEDHFITGRRVGRFLTACGAVVDPASLATEGRERCRRCAREAGR